jgi:hypothetical protein
MGVAVDLFGFLFWSACYWQQRRGEAIEKFRFLNRLVSSLLGADAHRVFHGENEDFSIADFPRLRGGDDRGDGFVGDRVADDDLDFHLGQKIDRVFAAAVDFGVTFLPAETFDFADGHALDAELGESVFHLLELEWFDDGFDLLHRGVFEIAVERAQGDAPRVRAPAALGVPLALATRRHWANSREA